MNKRIAIGMAIMAMTATAVQAATITNAAAGGLWSATGTWLGGVVPGAAPNSDLARITSSSTVTLNSTVANPLGNVQIGRAQGAGTLIVTNGGFLGMLSTATLEVGSAGATGIGTFIMNGGTVTGKTVTVANSTTAGSSAAIHGGTMTLDGPLTVGKFAAGSLTMDGGSILANKLLVGDTNNLFNGSTALTGGIIELATNPTSLSINTASKLTMGGTGELIWGGNRVAVIGGFVSSNSIIWSSGSSTLGLTYGVGDQTWTNGAYFLHADYDATDLKTRVWADTIPEPATIGMIGLGALITLLIRRFSGR